MICPECQTHNEDAAQFCMRCGHPFPLICPRCGASNPPEARFCNQCGLALVPAAHLPNDITLPGSIPTPEPASYIPAAPGAAAHAPATPEGSEERRVVTVLFADITSSTTLAENMDPEEVRSLLAAFFATMARQIHRHGGTVEKYIGDAVMAIFGLPLTHEDDPLRAVRAALDMQSALRDFNARRRAADALATELAMRIGINTGEVVAASGAGEGLDFLITGDPVNVAARLQQAAEPGTILVGPRTYRSTSGGVIYRERAALTLRGRVRPVRVWEVVALANQGSAPAPLPRGVDRLPTPLVGRDVELAALQALYARVVDERQAHLVTIMGVPGVGKSRLAREFFQRVVDAAPPARRPRVLEGRCPPYGEGITYWPLAEMLRTLCGLSPLDPAGYARERVLATVRDILLDARSESDPVLLAAYLGHTIGIETTERRQALLPADGQQRQEGMWRAWRTLFEALATKAPLLLLIDDIHRADEALLDLIEYIMTRVTGVPLMMAATARPELLERRPEWGSGKDNFAAIGLDVLPPGQAQRLIGELLAADAPESLRASILERAEGNPFYVEEIVRMLIDRGLLVRDERMVTGWRVAPGKEHSPEVLDPSIPDTVQGVLAARLDLLPEDERDILQHAAVVGRAFWASALRSLHREYTIGQVREILDGLHGRHLIREVRQPDFTVAPAGEQVYTFNHTLTREVTYAAIPRARRAHEHAQVARWLESIAQGRESEIADMLARHYYQYYVQGNLARSRDEAQRRAVAEKALHYLILAGDQAAQRHGAMLAERDFTDALEILTEDLFAPEVSLRIELLMKRGDAAWLRMRGDDAWRDYREALRLWAAYSERALILPDGASVHLPVALGLAVEDVEPLPGDTQPSCLSIKWRSWGVRLYRLLVQLPSRSRSLFQAPLPYADILQFLTEGLALTTSMRVLETVEGAALLAAKAFFWWSWGDRRGERELLDALRSAAEAVRIAEALGDPRGASEALDALGNMQSVTADLRGALETQSRRLRWAEQFDDVHELVDIHAEVCMANAQAGQFVEAIEHGNRAVALAGEVDGEALLARSLRSLTVSYFEWDRWNKTIETGSRLRALATLPGSSSSEYHHWALLVVAVCHERMGDHEAADEVLRASEELPAFPSVQFLMVCRARLALARGEDALALQLLSEGLTARSGRVILPQLLSELAELSARMRDRRLYTRFGAQALEMGWRSGSRKGLAQAIRARGIVSTAARQWDDALTDLESALNRYHELATPWEEGRTHEALAWFYQRRDTGNDAMLAQEALSRALALYEAQHAMRDMERVRLARVSGLVSVLG